MPKLFGVRPNLTTDACPAILQRTSGGKLSLSLPPRPEEDSDLIYGRYPVLSVHRTSGVSTASDARLL